MKQTIKVIRSAHRTISLEITPSGQVLVRAPRYMSETEIRKFIEAKSSWLEKHLQKQEEDLGSVQAEGRVHRYDRKKPMRVQDI